MSAQMPSLSATTLPVHFHRLAESGRLTRLTCGGGLLLALIATGHGLWWRGQIEQRQLGQAREVHLRQQIQALMAQASALAAVQAQKSQLEQDVLQWQQSLPGKLEIAALLSDVNQAAVARGLQCDSLKPGPEVLREWGAELPVEIKISGNYQAMTAFAAALAHLPQIVTLHHLTLSGGKEGGALNLDAVAKIWRHLDPDEARSQRVVDAKAAKK